MELTAETIVQVSLTHLVALRDRLREDITITLACQERQRGPDELIAEAVEAVRAADTAVVVVATTDRVESGASTAPT